MITHGCRHFLQLVLWFSQVHVVAIHMKNKLKTWNLRFDLMWLCSCFALHHLVNKMCSLVDTYLALRRCQHAVFIQRSVHHFHRKETKEMKRCRSRRTSSPAEAALVGAACSLCSPQGWINPELCSCLHQVNSKITSTHCSALSEEMPRTEEPPWHQSQVILCRQGVL